MSSKTLLPNYPIARAGHDLFSSRKDLTIVMIPFERFSSFSKAVEDLYKTIDVPFNLIVVEGNAPESVRHSLEHHQSKYKNISIIYSDHQLSIGAAFNLAMPHMKTNHVFLMDNRMHVPAGRMSQLLQWGKDNPNGIICPNLEMQPHENDRDPRKSFRLGRRNYQSLGVQNCFFMSRDTIQKLGKFDEGTTPFTFGVDIVMAAEELGIEIFHELSVPKAWESEYPLWPMDTPLYSFQWDENRVADSLKALEEKWGIHFQEQDYSECLELKKKELQDSKNIFFVLSWLVSHVRFFEDKPVEEAQSVLFEKAA